MKIATQIGEETINEMTGARWRRYRCEPPMDSEGGSTEYVIVSAVYAMFTGPETYIFPASATGDVTDWGELDGSFRGGLDHAEALRQAGYEVRPIRKPRKVAS